ncbi:MAG: hypothetical protein IPJ79_05595 [Bacteroidetes bacterium]|nr:hypothetical protein [Bacteroidota bacterium]
MKALPAGLYIVETETKNGVIRKRLIVSR